MKYRVFGLYKVQAQKHQPDTILFYLNYAFRLIASPRQTL